MLSEKIGHRLDKPLTAAIGNGLAKRLHPTFFTLSGLVLNLAAGGAIIGGALKTAAMLIAAAGLCDMLDGATAREFNKTSAFGGFLDSVVDRYSDMALMCAIAIYYARSHDIPLVVVTLIATAGTLLIPYTRARAETFIKRCNNGIMERPERIILLATGCLLDILQPILWLLAVTTHVTVLQRMYRTWVESRQ